MNRSKKVLLVLETKNDIISHFKKNLEYMGYEVTTFPEYNFKPYQLTNIDKVINIFSKYFKKTNTSLLKKKENHRKNYQIKQEQNIFSGTLYDFTIVFRPDLLELSFLEKLKAISKKIIAYQWDGMKRYPKIMKTIHCFDFFYCFNPEDENDKVKFITNFYFDYFKLPKVLPQFDIIYIGYYYEDRFKLLENIGEILKNKKLNFELKSFVKEEIQVISNSANIKLIDKIHSYSEFLKLSNESDILLDIKHNVHSGLSFRFFEAIQMRKKIITTNDSISQYDFYNQKNIFILRENYDISAFSEFLESDYQMLQEDIIKKYSFSNWFNNLIDSDHKIPIKNPIQIN